MAIVKNTMVETKVEHIKKFIGSDLDDLCDATEATLLDDQYSFNIGMNRSEPLVKERLETYWNGVLMVPERQLIVGRVDGIIASSIQLVKASPNDQTTQFCGSVDHHFVAPWARGHGLAKDLLELTHQKAIEEGLEMLRLTVRASQKSAIKLYERMGYMRWGTLDKYERINGKVVAGHFYYKDL